MVLFLALVGWARAAAPCAEPSSLASVQASISAAMDAYEAVDLEKFEASVEAARAAVPCLVEVVPPSTAASLHRVEGLSAFVASQPERSAQAFAAARRLEPGYRFATTVVPEGNPVLERYELLDPAGLRIEAAPAPETGSLRIDGRPARERPVDAPAVVQWVEPAGAVGLSGYVWPGDPLPAYAQRSEVAPLPSAVPVRRSLRSKLLIGAAIGSAATGALYAANWAVYGAWSAADPETGDLAGLRAANNGLVIASGTTLTLTIATGAAGLLTKR